MRTHLRQAPIVAIAIAIGAPVRHAAADIVINGSFENVTNPGPDIDDWIELVDARSGLASNYSAGSPYGARLLAFNDDVLDVGGGSATQDFGPLPVGQDYLVSFAYAQFGGSAGDQTLGVTINTTSVPIPQEFFTDSAPATDLATGWKRGSFTFTSNGFVSGITFTDGLAPFPGIASGSNLLVDDVSIVAVPESAPLLFLAAAGAVAAVVSVRARRQTTDTASVRLTS